MNTLLNITDLWLNFIIPFINPQLKVLSELRSVSKRFKQLLQKSIQKYIAVPSIEYPTWKSAYLKIIDVIDKNKKPPVVFLDTGEFTIGEIICPMVIIGRHYTKTKIYDGINFNLYPCYTDKMKEQSLLENLSITNKKDAWNAHAGITLKGKQSYQVNINNCVISGCHSHGISCQNGHLNVSNCQIFNNQIGIHIYRNNSSFKISDCDIHHNQNGIVVGNIYNNWGYLENIRCFSNSHDGIAVGGWDGSNVVIQGSKTDIYDNGYLNQSYHSSGVSTDYAGKIIFENLTKEVSHDNSINYYKNNFKNMLTEGIVFKFKNQYKGIKIKLLDSNIPNSYYAQYTKLK